MRGFMEKARIWLGRVMYGRYGTDELSVFMYVAGLVMLFISMIFHYRVFYLAGTVLIVLSLYRIFSKNHAVRQKERKAYIRSFGRVKSFVSVQKKRFRERKMYKYFRCPQCRTYNRIPRGHGKIVITCPKCHSQFQGKS